VVVRAADGERPSSREVCDHVAALLPAHMVPSRILFADSLPLAPSGKLDRRETARLADRLSNAR
jgi:acyl-CoA synthetase (AMP-forming)/AMP-acid ligase II